MAAAIQEDGDMGSVDRDDAHGTARRMSRKEKRKLLKKERRRLARREAAKKEQEEKEARLNDPEEQLKLEKMEQEEAKRMERDRLEFEKRERCFLEALEEKKRMEEQEGKKREEEQQRRQLEESQREQVENENPKEAGEGSDWEYVEEGPPEIIWQGNEIIVRKKKIRVPKKSEQQKNKEDIGRPISNPLAPECETFEDFKNAQELLECVAQKVPNFGTEQDKAHCPFHLKTGACRFGMHCSRVHFYPDKSCTLLMKNMYSGPGLSWEQDEGLEYTEEEIERSFEDFYEDVHTEFLKFGEIMNFKVCRNGSYHLRGNVYVQYKVLESAVLAYHSINGRYFAGKQITCDFVNVTKWKVAICGEFMKSRLKTCSRGSVCNFIHCFRNPGGDYEWAELDKEPPRYWVRKMAALFGYKGGYHKYLDSGSPSQKRGDKMLSRNAESCWSKGSGSEDLESRHIRSRCGDDRNTRRRFWHGSYRKENSSDRDTEEENIHSKDKCHQRRRNHETYSNDDESDGILKDRHYTHKRRRHRSRRKRGSIGVGSDSDEDSYRYESKIVNSRRNKTLYRDKTHNQDDDFDSAASSFEPYRDESGKGEERHTRSKKRGQRGRDSEPEDSYNDSTDEKDPKYSRRLSKQPRQGLQFSNCSFQEGRSDKNVKEEYSRHSSGSSRRKRKKSDLTRIDSPSRCEDSCGFESRKRGRDADRENKRSRANEKRRSSGHPRKYSLNDASTQANDHEEKIREDSYRDLVEGNCNEASMRCLKEAELNGSDERHEKGENEEGYEVQKLKAGSECLSFKQRSMDSGTEEMVYRRAALEKLEEKKRSKEKLLHQNSDNIVSLESGDISAPRSMPMEANVVSENQKDEKESVIINHRKRLRI